MNKTIALSTLIAILIYACSPLVTDAPTQSNPPASPTISGDSVLSTPESVSSVNLKEMYIVDKYVIEIPEDFTVYEPLSNSGTETSIYRVEAPNRSSFNIIVHPYLVSPLSVPGKCVVSTDFDAGNTSAPIFCEGLELINLFTIPDGRVVKYGNVTSDLSLMLCTANSPCPVDVPIETRYSTTYVFVIADKSLETILEFYAGDAFRSPSNEVDSFEGLGAILYNSIIPSLSKRNP